MEVIQVAFITLSGVIFTAVLTWHIAERRLLVEHITAERTKWREKIREKALKVHDAILGENFSELSKLKNEFQALLNPIDKNDQEILSLIDTNKQRGSLELQARKFSQSVSLLLKHDWERAKLEAGFILWRFLYKAERIKLKEAFGENGERIGCNLPRSKMFRIRC